MPKVDIPEEIEDDATAQEVKAAQGLTGELLWLAIRSRPDLSYAVSVMGRQSTKRPRLTVMLGKHVLGFWLPQLNTV